MSLGKAMIGGLIGAAVGAAIWLGVENMMSRNLPWLALLVGLCGGLGVRLCCPKDHRSFITGTIAAVMALLGVVMGPMANQMWLQYNFERKAKPIVTDEQFLDESDAIDDEEDADAADVEETDVEEIEPDEGDNAANAAAGDADFATARHADPPTTKSIVQAARPFLAQATAEEGDAPPSAIKAFFEKNRDLIIYAASAILAYILGSGGSKKDAAPIPAAGGGGSPE